jgi:hypothetical protein
MTKYKKNLIFWPKFAEKIRIYLRTNFAKKILPNLFCPKFCSAILDDENGYSPWASRAWHLITEHPWLVPAILLIVILVLLLVLALLCVVGRRRTHKLRYSEYTTKGVVHWEKHFFLCKIEQNTCYSY